MNQTRYIAGAMSGTSADGVDVAIVRVEGTGIDLSACVAHHHHRSYPPALRQEIFQVKAAGAATLPVLAELTREISLIYATAVNEALVYARMTSHDLAAVAAHGQTLYHAPPLTMQALDPSLLAAEVGCAVISDFRRADCAAGGQGAPLVPWADYVLFRHPQKNRVLVNLGGIANFTFLPAARGIENVLAFDTGPGNCISDWLMREFMEGSCGMDDGGTRAGRGEVIHLALEQTLRHPYFAQRPPKSTDGPAMIEAFEAAFERSLDEYPLEDLLATACCVTARSLAGALAALPGRVDEMILSGGGTRNSAIMNHLKQALPHVTMLGSEDLGIKSEAKEALAFALLGAATLDGTPGNVIGATGARRGVVLGSITQRP